jgi:hypothetical protein
MARVAALALAAVLAAPPIGAPPGPATPTLTKPQRAALEAAVQAADTAPPAAPSGWQQHVLRASDGSHYVALGFDLDADTPPGPLTLYLRLVRRPAAGTTVTPARARSAVAEWLAGMRRDPLPNRPTNVIAVQRGEMPVGGTQAMRARGDAAAVGESTVAIALMTRERDRARAREEEQARQRRAELEGTTVRHPELLPFEDFDLRFQPAEAVAGRRRLVRAVVAGPGDYDVHVAWAWVPAGAKAPVARVVAHALTLPAAPPGEFGASEIILADSVGVREVPYPADQQTAHPYTIGPLEIVPAADASFTNAEPVNVVLQVVNPSPGDTGKPDVSVAFRLTRDSPAGRQLVATLTPLTYSEATLPADFDVRLGHPLFAAMALPLRGLARGRYTLAAVATDRRTRALAATEAAFTIVGTPPTLLAEAPPLDRRYRREALLEADRLTAIVDQLRPAAPSPALAALLDAAAAGRFADLLRAAPDDPTELGVRAALRGLAQYALGDSPTAAAVPLQRALQQAAAPAAPLQALLGACRAAAANDREALASWQAALDAGMPARTLAAPMAEAWLRLREPARARAVLAAVGTPAAGDAYARVAAALGTGDTRAALAAADAHLDAHADDEDVQFLRLRALYTALAGGTGATAEDRARFETLAAGYAARGGPHAALVREWAAVLPPR